MTDSDRRKCLALLAALTGSLWFPGLSRSAPSAEGRAEFFRRYPFDRESFRQYAEEHFRLRPSERNADSLLQQIFEGFRGDTPAQIKTFLLQSIRKDFAEGNIVTLDGWVLSLTEVRFWCLCSLLKPVP